MLRTLRSRMLSPGIGAMLVLLLCCLALPAWGRPNVQVPPDLQAHIDQYEYPRFMYYHVVLYWNKPGRRPEAVLSTAETFRELRAMHYNGLLTWTWDNRGSGRNFAEDKGIDTEQWFTTAAKESFGVWIGSAWTGISQKQLQQHPELRCSGLEPRPDQPCINEPRCREAMKQRLTEQADRYGEMDAVLGVYFDEPQWWGGYCPRCVNYFRNYLHQNFTEKELAERGIDWGTGQPARPSHPVSHIGGGLWKPSLQENPFLWHVSRVAANQAMYDFFEELRDHWRKVAPGKLFCINTHPCRSVRFPVSYALSKMAGLVDVQMCDVYMHGAPSQAYIWELHNYLHPNVWQIHNMFRNNPPTIRRGIHFATMHTDGIMSFDYRALYVLAQKHPKGYWYRDESKNYNPDKHASMVEAVSEGMGAAEAARDYLHHAETKSPVGIFHCEYNQINGFCGRYTTEDQVVYNLFWRNHIPIRALYLDTVIAEELEDFSCLVLTDKSVADEHVELLSRWVADGGVLIATNDMVSKYNRYGEERAGLGLGEVFGLNEKAEPRADKRAVVADVLPEGKPIRDPSVMVLLRKDKVPVALINKYGRGYGVMFFGSKFNYAQEYAEAEATGKALWLDLMDTKFQKEDWLETWAMVVNWAVSIREQKLPVAFPAGCPREVQINYREQTLAEQTRRITHLLNRQSEPVLGLKIEVQVPPEASIRRVVNIVSGEEMEYTRRGDAVVVTIPRLVEYVGVAVVGSG